MTSNQQPANRRTALLVFLGMIAMATIATVFILATTEFRRQSDTMRPDMPSLVRGLVVSLAIFFLAAGLIALLIRRRQQ